MDNAVKEVHSESCNISSISDFDITLCCGGVNQPIPLDMFTAICDYYVYKELCEACKEVATDSFVYSFTRGKVRASVKLCRKCLV